jgi:hypothetical protein
LFVYSGEGAIVGADDCRGSLAVEDQCYFSEVVALVEELSEQEFVVPEINQLNLTLPLRYKEKVISFLPLLHNDIVRLLQVRNDIFYQRIDQFLIRLEQIIPVKGIYEDVLHHQRFETGRQHIYKLVHLFLVV